MYTLEGIVAFIRRVRRSFAMFLTAASHTLTTQASGLISPTPTSGPKCRLPILVTNALARARRSCAIKRSSAFSARVSSSTKVLCSGKGLIESVSSNLKASVGRVFNSVPCFSKLWNNGEAGISEMPCSASFAKTRLQIPFACLIRPSGSVLQLTLVLLAKAATGLGSTPMLPTPSLLHSTRVVPVPQKGSRTVCEGPIPNR